MRRKVGCGAVDYLALAHHFMSDNSAVVVIEPVARYNNVHYGTAELAEQSLVYAHFAPLVVTAYVVIAGCKSYAVTHSVIYAGKFIGCAEAVNDKLVFLL